MPIRVPTGASPASARRRVTHRVVAEHEFLRHTTWQARAVEVLRALRFFGVMAGLLLIVSDGAIRTAAEVKTDLEAGGALGGGASASGLPSSSIGVVSSYCLAWVAVVLLVLGADKLAKIERTARPRWQRRIRRLSAALFATGLTLFAVGLAAGWVGAGEVLLALTATMTGLWGLLKVLLACNQARHAPVQQLARLFDTCFGLLLFLPVAALSWVPFISEFQTRVMFSTFYSTYTQVRWCVVAATRVWLSGFSFWLCFALLCFALLWRDGLLV
jgi:hypothetical protein